MATRLSDGSIRMADGRILYANSVILAADLVELMPLFTPPPAWPFVSGGGGGASGTPGARGADGAPGAPGVQGPQGTNPGVQGPQGNQGNQGAIGAGVQGPQGLRGFQGNQGNQGAIGAGVQGPQGNQGIVGAQGATGSGAQGFQGLQGPQGFQGAQGQAILNFDETTFVGGNQAIASASYVDITGATLSITTLAAGFVRFDGRASINCIQANPGPVTGASCAVAINVDGTDYPIGTVQMSGVEVIGSNSQNLIGIATGWKTLNLTAGAHTAKLRAKAISGTPTVVSTADAPSVIAATW